MRVLHPRGFTLLELLIVVFILGILAAVAVRQFGDTTGEVDESAAVQNLESVRRAIELYALQHDGDLPGKSNSAPAAPKGKGIGRENSNKQKPVPHAEAAIFVAQLTTKTDKTGAPGSHYGPYLERFPRSPLTGDASVKIVKSMPESPSGSQGWIYSVSDGSFRLNSDAKAPSGRRWSDL